MATFNIFYGFHEHLAEKVHNLGSDTLTIALTNTSPASACNASTAACVLENVSEISYDNCSTRTLTVTSSAQTDGVYRLKANDLTLTASGDVGPFRYVVLYNDSASNDEVIGYWDYGESITLHDGETFLIDFDGTNGVLSVV